MARQLISSIHRLPTKSKLQELEISVLRASRTTKDKSKKHDKPSHFKGLIRRVIVLHSGHPESLGKFRLTKPRKTSNNNKRSSRNMRRMSLELLESYTASSHVTRLECRVYSMILIILPR